MRQAVCRCLVWSILICFLVSSSSWGYASALLEKPLAWMPPAGVLLGESPDFIPAQLKGITVHPENPLLFDFMIDRGDKPLSLADKPIEYKRLIKYFLASLAIPDEDQWVNLSPYEKNRIIQADFGKTLMGRDLLVEDYMLKQVTASLIYPEKELGRKFWSTVYAKARKQYGTTDIPVNTFNKVWILPDDALIYEKGSSAYILKNHLRVMLEEDYLALARHQGIGQVPSQEPQSHRLGNSTVRDIVLPVLEAEVNKGKNFALLRQIYSGMLLAAWFKRALKTSLLGQIYMNKIKIQGVNQDPKNNQAIYRQYLRAYKKGVFNYIKDDTDIYTKETIPRKYFSGGMVSMAEAEKEGHPIIRITQANPAQMADVKNEANHVDFASTAMKSTDLELENLWDNVQLKFNRMVIDGQWSRLKESILTVLFYTKSTSQRTIAIEKIDGSIMNLLNIISRNTHNTFRKEITEIILLRYSKTRNTQFRIKANVYWQHLVKKATQSLINKEFNLFLPFVDELSLITREDVYLKLEINTQKEIEGLKTKVGQVFNERFLENKLSDQEWITLIDQFYKALHSRHHNTNIGDLGVKSNWFSVMQKKYIRSLPKILERNEKNSAQLAMDPSNPLGGIDLNGEHLNMQIKRDGKGVVLPLAQQDLAQLGAIEGLEPRILKITAADPSLLLARLQMH